MDLKAQISQSTKSKLFIGWIILMTVIILADFTASKIVLYPHLPFCWDLCLIDNGRIKLFFTLSTSNDGNAYTKVADLKFATRVVTAYLNRYAKRAIEKGDMKTLAKIHNGGPRGYKNPATDHYWMKVQRFLK